MNCDDKGVCHRIAHALGIANPAVCMSDFGRFTTEALIKGLEEKRMNNEKKVHLIADEKLGGLKRECVEVTNGSGIGVTTIESTDIVHHDNQRYRLVDRIAEVGEKVVTVKYYGNSKYKAGGVLTCTCSGEYADGSIDAVLGDEDDGDFAFFDTATDDKYLVLEPVEEAPKLSELLAQVTPENRHEEVFVDESQASPQVIDMLANLAQRIVDLERKVSGLTTTIERHELVNDRLNDEIDTLHTNQKRLGEELANKTAFDADEVIVELATLLAEAHRANTKVGSRA